MFGAAYAVSYLHQDVTANSPQSDSSSHLKLYLRCMLRVKLTGSFEPELTRCLGAILRHLTEKTGSPSWSADNAQRGRSPSAETLVIDYCG